MGAADGQQLRAFVDLRTNGKNAYATPSEYVRDLIRADMEREVYRIVDYKKMLDEGIDLCAPRIYPVETSNGS